MQLNVRIEFKRFVAETVKFGSIGTAKPHLPKRYRFGYIRAHLISPGGDA